MAKLDGFTCDICVKHTDGNRYGNVIGSWYTVYPACTRHDYEEREYHFCSKECLTAWVTDKNAVPESKGALFKKLLKALVR